MTMRRPGPITLVLVAILFIANTLYSQTPLGSRGAAPAAQNLRLSGRVLDPSSAVMFGGDVKVFQGTNLIKEGKTDERGTFSFDLPPGEYRIEATADEVFSPFRQTVRLQASSTVTIP